MSRPMIHCPGCGRELYHLQHPHCLWCGARIAEDQFAQVAAPPGMSPPPPQPLPMMPPPGAPLFGRGGGLFEGNPFPLIKRSVSPWERRLRIAGAALFVCLMLARLAEVAWNMWQMSHLMPPGH
jgi:hypothetical protein